MVAGHLLGLAIAVSLAGCSDAAKRSAGRNLQNATRNATALYAQASNMLGQSIQAAGKPGQPRSDKALDPAIVKLLDQAEAELMKALKDNYQGLPESTIPQADVALAKMTLATVRNLTGQCYAYAAREALKEATGLIARSREQLTRAEHADGFVQTFDLRVRNAKQSMQNLDTQANAINKVKATLSERKTKLTTEIAQRQAAIDRLNKKIDADSARASSLRKDSAISTGQASLGKFDAALKIEEGIRADRVTIAKMQNEVRELKGRKDYCDYQLGQADHKLSQIARNRKNCKFTATRDAQLLREQTNKVASLWKSASQAQASAGQACRRALGLADQARDAWQGADEQLSQAGRLESDKLAAILAANSESKALAGALEMTLCDMHHRVESFAKRVQSLWGQLHIDKPEESVDAFLKDFLDKTASCAEQALANSNQALALSLRASKASPQSRRWFYQRDIVVAYARCAQALELAGQEARARAMLDKARNLIGKIRRQAKTAKQKSSVLQLQKLLETKPAKSPERVEKPR
jgi:hypothetical protein